MTNSNMKPSQDPRDYECLDPTLGSQMWRHNDPKCDPGLFERLETHRVYCAHCRLQVAVEDRAEAGLRDGSLELPDEGLSSSRLVNWAAGVGAAALAAGLALMLLLPPTAAHKGMIVRGDESPAILSPVPDEVVRGGRPELQWTALEGANRYEVEVSMVGGDHRWSTTIESNSVVVPTGMDLPVGERFRIEVAPIPAHAAPEGALRSSFQTGDTGDWLGYRMRRGNGPARLFGAGGLLALLGAGAMAFWHRRQGTG